MIADDVEELLEACPGRHFGGFCVRFGLQLATIGAPLDLPATRQGHRERHQQLITIADDVGDLLGAFPGRSFGGFGCGSARFCGVLSGFFGFLLGHILITIF